ncbi:tetratricopeptide repeat protein [Xanthobacter autotrophicus]|uniref:O-linked N-acetylglucosamine transferase, SPINDLY family protein n=1 Tax=Xanthobacter TaxID=279 RepID=UPI0024AABC37|nr:tetratricopeptide repeat protein [Xanthobacter autotrophicus]MDI4663098.1 tetratricopeptide repeat protein [Xanthobacter autotrophicus]
MPPSPPPGPAPLTPALQKLLYDGYQHQLRGQYEEAARHYRKILRSAPDQMDVVHLLGIVRARQSRENEAIELYKKVLARRPDDAKAWHNLSLAYGALGKSEDSLAAMERAFDLDPGLPLAANLLLPPRRAIWDWRGHDRLFDLLKHGTPDPNVPALPFVTLYVDDPALHLATARRKVLEEKIPARPRVFDHSARRTASGPIRIAYLSADFRTHATTFLISKLLAGHDRTRFEVTAISVSFNDDSPQRQSIVAAVDHFLDREKATPAAIAEEVAGLGIDVFVDLMGHTSGECLGAFAERPAPVQVNFLGYPGTSGAPFIDYVIADPVVLPFSDAAFFTEKIVHLPECYQPNDPDLPVGERPTRAECGLPEDAFVFCAFNSAWKLDPEVFSAYARILKAVPGSVLWVLQSRDNSADNLRREARARGLDPDRLVFAPMIALKDHFARLPLADLFLDTFPYTAHTTASDMLRMGLPMVTRTGRSFASRVAASIMAQMDIADCVTTDVDSFVDKAVALANDPAALADARARLAAARATSPLFDIDRFARHIERAYETMVERFRAGLPPEAFAVEPLPRG